MKKIRIIKYTIFSFIIILASLFLNEAIRAEELEPISPLPPQNISAENTDDGIELSWNEVKGVDGYFVYSNGEKIKTIASADTTTFLDKKATMNVHKYSYRITSFIKQKGQRIESKKSPTCVQYYLCSSNILVNTFTGGCANITLGNKNHCDGYEIAYSKTEDFKKVKIIKTTSKELKIKNLSKKSNYYFRVRTFKKKNNVSYYSPWKDTCAIIAWDDSWKYAKNSQIHDESVVLYYSSVNKRKNKVICVNAGHGAVGGESKQTLCHPDGTAKVTGGTGAKGSIKTSSISSGTTLNDGTSERTANLAIAKAVRKKLLEAGYDVLMIRETNDYQLDNIARTTFANFNADCHIAIHYDSTSSNKGAFYIGVPDVASYRKMEPVASNWQKHEKLGKALIEGMRDNKVKIYSNGRMAVDLTQTSYSMIPSVDIEVGDKASDHSETAINRIADGIVDGVDSFYK